MERRAQKFTPPQKYIVFSPKTDKLPNEMKIKEKIEEYKRCSLTLCLHELLMHNNNEVKGEEKITPNLISQKKTSSFIELTEQHPSPDSSSSRLLAVGSKT